MTQAKNIRPVVIIVNKHYPVLTLTGPIFRRHLFTYFYENDCIISNKICNVTTKTFLHQPLHTISHPLL